MDDELDNSKILQFVAERDKNVVDAKAAAEDYINGKMEPFILEWFTSKDITNNTMYEAFSPYHNDGNPIMFRICKRLRDDKIIFYEDSDYELVGDVVSREWEDIVKAKADIQKDANEIVNYINEENDRNELVRKIFEE